MTGIAPITNLIAAAEKLVEGAGDNAERLDMAAAEAESGVVAARTLFADFAAFAGCTTLGYDKDAERRVAAGDTLLVLDGHIVYRVSPEGAADALYLTKSGVGVYLQPGPNGMVPATGLGAIADGRDNCKGHTHGHNAETGASIASTKWASGVTYTKGTPIVHYGGVPGAVPDVRYFVAIQNHVASPDFSTDGSRWAEFHPWWHSLGVAYKTGDIVMSSATLRGHVCKVDHVSTGPITSDMALWDDAGFSGSDNTPVKHLAVEHFYNKGIAVYWPAGSYRFAIPDHETLPPGGTLHNVAASNRVVLVGEARKTKFLLDEAPSRRAPGHGQSFWLGGRQETSQPTNRLAHTEVIIEGIEVRGGWTHRPGGSETSANGVGVCPFRFEGFALERFVRVGGVDIANKLMRNKASGAVDHRECYGKRLARGLLRSSGSQRVFSRGHRIEQTGDDAADYAMVADARAQVGTKDFIVSEIFLRDTQNLNLSASHGLIASQIVSERGKGATMTIARAGNNSPGNGLGSKIGIEVFACRAEDPLNGYDHHDGEFVTPSAGKGAFALAGSRRIDVEGQTQIGRFDQNAGRVVRPYDKNAASIAPSPMLSDFGADEVVPPGMFNKIEVAAMRKRPEVDAYSRWGHGPMFTQDGWANPAVRHENWVPAACALQSDLWACVVTPHSFGLSAGLTFSAAGSNFKEDAFRSIKVRHPMIFDARRPIWVEDPGQPVTWTITVDGGEINADPFHTSPHRGQPLDGTWQEPGDDTDAAFYVPANVTGFVARATELRNCARVVPPGGGGALLLDLLAYCDPVSVGAFDPANKGIGDVPAGTHVIRETSDPAEPTAGTIISMNATV